MLISKTLSLSFSFLSLIVLFPLCIPCDLLTSSSPSLTFIPPLSDHDDTQVNGGLTVCAPRSDAFDSSIYPGGKCGFGQRKSLYEWACWNYGDGADCLCYCYPLASARVIYQIQHGFPLPLGITKEEIQTDWKNVKQKANKVVKMEKQQAGAGSLSALSASAELREYSEMENQKENQSNDDYDDDDDDDTDSSSYGKLFPYRQSHRRVRRISVITPTSSPFSPIGIDNEHHDVDVHITLQIPQNREEERRGET